MFSVPVPPRIVAWHRVVIDRRAACVEIVYSEFHDSTHAADVRRPPWRQVAVITVSGQTAAPLLSTTDNHLYDDARALIGRLLTGAATEQEQGDVTGWQELAEAVLVPGVEHLDSDPFELTEAEEESPVAEEAQL